MGVPVIAPVVELNDSPAGSDPLVMLHEVAAPPVLVGVMVLMAVFFVNVYGPLYAILGASSSTVMEVVAESEPAALLASMVMDAVL